MRSKVAAVVLSTMWLGACSVRTTVSMSATTAPQIQHLYVTVQEVWLNTSASALPTAAGWVGQVLTTPLTVDLTTLNAGTLLTLISGQKVNSGTYRQLRIVLADASATLTSSAQSAGLASNAEVQYLDASGNTVTLPLEMASPSSQLLIPISLVLTGSSSELFGGGSSSSTTGSSTTGAGTTGTVAAGTTTTTGASSSSTTTLKTLIVDVGALRNLLLFNYGAQVGALLDPTLSVFDSSLVGGISGSVDLSAVSAATLTGPQGIVVTAEALSGDGSRYAPIKSVALQSGASFTLYPLPVAKTGTTTYDLVIHGPGMRTLIITAIPVTAGPSSSATVVQPSAIAVAGASSYTVNTAANASPVAGGATVGFYQTLPGTSVPHLAEYALLDPFSGGFSSNLSLSADAIDFGAYNGGSDVTLNTAAPAEGIGVYKIGTTAPFRADSGLTASIGAPLGSVAAVQPIYLPALGIASGASSGSLGGTVSFAPAGRFDNGYLLVSHGGELVDVVNLTPSLGNNASSVTFNDPGLPVGAPTAIYDVSVRMWNSANPGGTLTRAALTTRADLSSGSVQGLSLNIP